MNKMCFHDTNRECWWDWHGCENLCPKSPNRIKRFLYFIDRAKGDGGYTSDYTHSRFVRVKKKTSKPFNGNEEEEVREESVIAPLFNFATHELLNLVLENRYSSREFARDLSWAWINFGGAKKLIDIVDIFLDKLRVHNHLFFNYRKELSERMRVSWAMVDGCAGLARYLKAAMSKFQEESEKVVTFKNEFSNKTEDQRLEWLFENGGDFGGVLVAEIIRGQQHRDILESKERVLDCIPDESGNEIFEGHIERGDVQKQREYVSFEFGENVKNPFADDEGVREDFGGEFNGEEGDEENVPF